MYKIKKFYSEYYISIEKLKFLKIHDIKIRIFKYLIDNPSGEYEAILNISFEEKYEYDSNIQLEPEDYYGSFIGYGIEEEEAIENLITYLEEEENINLLKTSKIRVDF